MKKEINYLLVCFSIVIITLIVAFTLKNKKNKASPTEVTKTIYIKPDVDWTNTNNPAKKVYLEHLYNNSK